jgi:hypothetical protein
MPAPIQTRNTPIKAEEPLAMAVVNPPICSACGENVFMRAPIINGTTIIPPGILSIFFFKFIFRYFILVLVRFYMMTNRLQI